MAGVDVHHRERDAGRGERTPGEVEHHDRVLAAGEQQHRPGALGGDLADDGDRLVLEVGGRGGRRHGFHQASAAERSASVPETLTGSVVLRRSR